MVAPPGLGVTSPLAKAMLAGDVTAIGDAFAPGALFRSPLTDGLAFQGREQIGILATVLLEAFQDFRYTHEVVSGDQGFLVACARVGGRDLEMVDHFRTDPQGLIADITIFFRPLPAAAVALRVIGAGLGRHRSRGRGAIISALASPLAVMAQMGDRVGVSLVRGALRH